MFLPPSAENQPKEQATIPAIVAQKPEVLTSATPTLAEVKAEENSIPSNEVAKSDAIPAQNIPAAEVVTATDNVAANAASDGSKAKRKARRRAEAVESQKLQEIRPTPVSGRARCRRDQT